MARARDEGGQRRQRRIASPIRGMSLENVLLFVILTALLLVIMGGMTVLFLVRDEDA